MLTVGVARLGVTGRLRVELAELLEIVDGELVAQEMEEDVLQSATGQRLASDQAFPGITYACLHGHVSNLVVEKATGALTHWRARIDRG